MRFEWDENKNKTNIKVHGIDFRDTHFVFENPMLIKTDSRRDYGEERLVGLGVLYGAVIVIVFTNGVILYVLYLSGGQTEMNAKSIKKSSKSKTDLTKLHRKTDDDINYDDSPATTKNFWKDAKVFMPQHKVHISLRLDEAIVNYFKEEGSGYQSRINAVLKAYIHTHPHNHK